jgi:DNA-directed RNA polymerase specialized sigma54-like protein
MTSSVIEALSDLFNTQQLELNNLADALQKRQQVIEDFRKAFLESQTMFSSLQKQLLGDNQIENLSNEVKASTADIAKLVAQVKSLKIPTSVNPIKM